MWLAASHTNRLPSMACAYRDASSVMWNRMYSKEAMTPYDRFVVCRQLKATLEATGAKHMVIGHTPQVAQAILHLQGDTCENGNVRIAAHLCLG